MSAKQITWTLDELIEQAQDMESDYAYRASKKIKDPKIKRQNQSTHAWSLSLLTCLKELKQLREKK
jgi:hypothetical protein